MKALLDQLRIVVTTYHYYVDLIQVWILLAQLFLKFLDLYQLLDAIQLGHLYVSEDDLVSNVAAGLRHVLPIHLNCFEAVLSLVADFIEVSLNHYPERHQIKNKVVY